MPWVKWNPLPALFRIMVKPAEFAASTYWQHWANTDHELKAKLSCEITSQPLLELLLHLCLDIDKMCCSNTIDQFITYPQWLSLSMTTSLSHLEQLLKLLKNAIILITADFYSSMMALLWNLHYPLLSENWCIENEQNCNLSSLQGQNFQKV